MTPRSKRDWLRNQQAFARFVRYLIAATSSAAAGLIPVADHDQLLATFKLRFGDRRYCCRIDQLYIPIRVGKHLQALPFERSSLDESNDLVPANGVDGGRLYADNGLSLVVNQKDPLIYAAIDKIASDNTSGAAEILRLSAEVFSLLNSQHTKGSSISIEQGQRLVMETCVALVLAQPDMTSLLRLASDALAAARNTTDALRVLKSVEEAALTFIERAGAAANEAARHAANFIPSGRAVLTHSRSSTVLAALVEARRQGKEFSVISTESRPMLEGRVLAEALAVEGVRVSLITDAAAARMLDEVDLVLVGADKVTPDHLLNKIGTRMIALAARERGVPAYGVCDTSKFIDADYLIASARDQLSADELWPEAPEGVVVVNRYFEPTPLALLAAIITEQGKLTPEETARRAERASIDIELADALARYRSEY